MSPREQPTPLLCAIASLALRYPSADVVARRAEVAGLAADLPRKDTRETLRRFLGWWLDVPALALESAYVETFDLQRRACLYLTYYQYGDRRQRGQEFVRLKHLVEGSGYRFTGRELPDYLPLLLEFAALEPDAGVGLLTGHRVGLELLRSALLDMGSPWADVVTALCLELPPLDRDTSAAVMRLAAEGPPGETVGLEPFGPPEVMPESAWGAPLR